jgi:iron(III) transport system permease protein
MPRLSPLILERPSRWRGAVFALLVALLLLPFASIARLDAFRDFGAGGEPFWAALGATAAVACGTFAVSLLLGLPVGTGLGLYRAPMRRLLISLFLVALVLPSFLLAIGWSMIGGARVDGISATVLAHAAAAVSLVTLSVLFATRSLNASALDAARIAGGETRVFASALRSAFPLATLFALYGGILSAADPGPGQILGVTGAASQVLVSFSALYDFGLATRQCLLLSFLSLAVIAPLVPALSRELVQAERTVRPAPLNANPRAAWIAAAAAALVLTLFIGAPALGLVIPASFDRWERAWAEVQRTLSNTVLYGLGAGLLGTALGLPLALVSYRSVPLRRALFCLGAVLLALPSSLTGLAMLSLATAAPAELDFLLRSRWTVVGVSALRLVPIAAWVQARALGALPRAWAEAAEIQGISLASYSRHVLIPALIPAAALSIGVVALLALGDTSIPLLLRPPGEDSFPIALFTIMANAPEALVATLCLLQLSGVLGIVLLGSLVMGGSESAR